jgi:WD40 repeat protein
MHWEQTTRRLVLVAAASLATSCAQTDLRYRASGAPGDYVGELWRCKGGACPVFSPDGCLVACTGGDLDPSVRILDADTGKPISSFDGHGDLLWHSFPVVYPLLVLPALVYPPLRLIMFYAKTNAVSAIAFSPDGRDVLSGGRDDNTLKLWRARCGWPVKAFGGLAAEKRGYRSVCIDRSARRFMSVATDNAIAEWSMSSARQTWHTEPSEEPVYQVAFTPDCTQFVTCGADGYVKVWDAVTHRVVRVFDLWGSVYQICVSADGQRMSAATRDGFQLWDLARGAAIKRFCPRGYPVINAEMHSNGFFRDGRHVLVLACTDAGPARLGTWWLVLVDLEREREVQRWNLSAYTGDAPPLGVAISPDGRLAAFSAGATVHMWKLPKLPAWGEEIAEGGETGTRPAVAPTQPS